MKSYDFSGWATRNDLRCSDGRIIKHDAFKDNDGQTVPLVWNHQHNDANNVLGHALLENRDQGVYAYCTFNETESGRTAKMLVQHGDVNALSIYANKLKQNGSNVLHGSIREVSLVLAGANPGAYIDSVIRHGEESDEEAIIYTGEDIELSHAEEEPEQEIEHAEKEEAPKKEEPMKEEETKEETGKEKTVGDVVDSMTDEQKTVMYALIGQALKKGDAEVEDEKKEEPTVKHNVFSDNNENEEEVLSHAEMAEIVNDAKRNGSMKEAFLAHGINQIDYLFPEAKNVGPNEPIFVQRNMEWVSAVMNGVHHTPFSRIKSMFADITADEARAKGYIKGNRKTEEVFALLKRTTTPTTIYKKQKMDRDDVVDIVDIDVIAWLKKEMRMMLDEEIARAILISDGRSAISEDKISEEHIRPVWTDDDLFTVKFPIVVASNATPEAKAKAFIRAAIKSRKEYKGSGNPVMFMTEDILTECLLLEDLNQRIIYDTEDKLKTALRVSKIVTVPVMEGLTRTVQGNTHELAGIYLNLNDYNVGADKGGAVNMFDDFDIDYNQMKYLIETRCSGALTKPFSAVVLEFTEAAPITLGVAPESQDKTLLGKKVRELQTGVTVFGDQVAGTLNYVTGYTGFSGDTDEQSGNYLALKFTASAGATTTVQKNDSDTAATLDADMNCIFRITSATKTITVVSTKSGQTITKVLDLSGLVKKSA